MQLNSAQLATLGNALRAETNPDVVAAVAGGNATFLTEWCNSNSTFVVWRTAVTREELQNLDAFNWTVVDNLSTGSKYRIWEWMFTTTGAIDASKANVRAGIAATWVGNAALLAVQAAVLAGCKRFANQAEKVFVTGTGTTVAPGALTLEGFVSVDDVGKALNESA